VFPSLIPQPHLSNSFHGVLQALHGKQCLNGATTTESSSCSHSETENQCPVRKGHGSHVSHGEPRQIQDTRRGLTINPLEECFSVGHCRNTHETSSQDKPMDEEDDLPKTWIMSVAHNSIFTCKRFAPRILSGNGLQCTLFV
jgi:hypothetical protein